jgi:mevalonate kinase
LTKADKFPNKWDELLNQNLLNRRDLNWQCCMDWLNICLNRLLEYKDNINSKHNINHINHNNKNNHNLNLPNITQFLLREFTKRRKESLSLRINVVTDTKKERCQNNESYQDITDKMSTQYQRKLDVIFHSHNKDNQNVL